MANNMSQQQQAQNKPVTPPISTMSSDSDIEKLLKIEQLKALQRQNAEAEAKELARLESIELEKFRKREVARAQDQERAKNTELQSMCTHMTDGKSVVVGLGTWDTHKPPIYMCQSCMKVWERETSPGVIERMYPPGHLMPKPDRVGGPQVNAG